MQQARDDAGKKAQNSVDLRNNIIKMVTAGSKGSFINISQMMGCVGQQNVEGKRIPFNFDQRCVFVKPVVVWGDPRLFPSYVAPAHATKHRAHIPSFN